MDYNRLTLTLKRHEGLVLKPYQCTSGKLTIGIGRNLEDQGITEHEAYMLLQADILRCEKEVLAHIPCYKKLNEARQEVLVNMCFNLGIKGLLSFKKFLTALTKQDFMTASKEMLNSQWAKQVGERAIELSDVIKTGSWIHYK